MFLNLVLPWNLYALIPFSKNALPSPPTPPSRPSQAVQTFPDGATSLRSLCPTSRWKRAPFTLHDWWVSSQPSPQLLSVSSNWNVYSRRTEIASVPMPRILHTAGTQYVSQKERMSLSFCRGANLSGPAKGKICPRFHSKDKVKASQVPGARLLSPVFLPLIPQVCAYQMEETRTFVLISWDKWAEGGLALSPSDPGTSTQRNEAFPLPSLPASLWDRVPRGRSGEARGGQALISLPAHTPLELSIPTTTRYLSTRLISGLNVSSSPSSLQPSPLTLCSAAFHITQDGPQEGEKEGIDH